MAPLTNILNSVVRRQNSNFDDDDDDYRCNVNGYCYSYSRWDDWGRWVALAVIVIVVLIIAFGFSCINNRRRRRRGAAPMYGTGWIPGAKPQTGHYGNNQNYYGQQHYNAPAPPYSAAPVGHQQTGNTFNSNDGYYGQPHGGAYEMQPPQSAYHPQRGGEPVYDAPEGPPPTKGDGIIR
ncbi:hypothetical protein PVAG01_09332 [Phlyctema vagabunda]|uniref:Uncharacterized protein n=1 Tax=Phlyctema vagabunda TaxID=108571 RepID=A0ABR4P744_9HELO